MKDWDKIDDNEFDDLFKQSADGHSEELWPNAWPLMEEKLDEKKRRFFVFWPWAAAIFVLLSAGIIANKYFLNNSDSPSLTTVPQAVLKKPEIAADSNTSLSATAANVSIKKPQTDFKETNSAKANKKSVNPNNSPQTIEIDRQELTESESVAQKNKIEKTITPTEEIANGDKQLALTNPIDKSNSSLDSNSSEKVILTEVQKNTVAETTAMDTIIVSIEDTGMLAKDESLVKEQSNIQSLANELMLQNDLGSNKSRSILRKLSFNLGLSPDYSKVQESQMGASGYNFQLLLNFQITQRLALKTGVIRALKFYDAKAANYKWPDKWGVPSSPLQGVSAKCNMWDFPVALSYDVLQKGKTKYYTTLGLTNYKMIKETYTYHYENDADPNLKRKKWEGSSGFFGAGILNFSLGLERKITNKISIQVEPFVKIPIKNIGFGSVKLYSTGLFLNVKLPQLKN